MCSLGRILFFILLLLLFVGNGNTPTFAFSQDVKDAQVLLNSFGIVYFDDVTNVMAKVDTRHRLE